MRIHTSDKVMAYLALLSGLTISAVAIYYSVAGLVAIFAAAVIPIIVMGVALEISKLVATVWLKQNWKRAPWFIKTYLLTSISILMIITSMGIFGFLSKAHSDQALVSGDVGAKIAIIDEKIKIERENIANAQQVIKQMDAAVNGVISTGDQEIKLRDGSTQIKSAAERSLQIRRSQAKDRAKLTAEIEQAQARIVKMQEEAAPIRAEVRKVEAEVGPIKYIAALIYGDNPDTNLLERAVRWVIIIIVAVFDPLAVILLLSSQYSFQWFRDERDKELEKTDSEETPTENIPEPEKESINDPVPESKELVIEPKKETTIEYKILEDVSDEEPTFHEQKPLDQWKEEIEEEDDEEDSESVREAKRLWKQDNPDDSLKRHRRLLASGEISELPWMKYIKAEADYVDQDALEAARWAQEQVESKKKDSDLDGDAGEKSSNKDAGEVTYSQNSEQNEQTLWNRIKESKK